MPATGSTAEAHAQQSAGARAGAGHTHHDPCAPKKKRKIRTTLASCWSCRHMFGRGRVSRSTQLGPHRTPPIDRGHAAAPGIKGKALKEIVWLVLNVLEAEEHALQV